MYDPHKNPDMAGEADIMSRGGRLVKARLPDQEPPNVGWYWIRTGNCLACKFFTPEKCLNPKIKQEDFYGRYITSNDCPEFKAGLSDKTLDGRQDTLDVMKAVGLVSGEPGQRVIVLYDKPWSMEAALRAHREESIFLDMARLADYVARGGKNDPSSYEYVDLSDPLEGGVKNQPGAILSVLDDAPPQPVPTEVSVHRDWDELRCVVVGTIENNVFAPVPWQPSVKGLPREGGVTYEDFAPEEYRLAVQQLENLCGLLESEGVTVLRPPRVPLEEAMAAPVGLTQLYAREAFSVIGEHVFVNQCRTPYRRKEARAAEALFVGLDAARLVHLPPAPDDVADSPPDDPLPYLEGGDVYRIGNDVLVTVSGLATSPAGYGFVAGVLAPLGMRTHLARINPKFEHGDYVLMLIRKGLCVLQRDAFLDGIPPVLKDWECVDISAEEANKGMAANGIVLRENLVVLPAGNARVVAELGKRGVDVIEIEFDGVSYFGGAVDCATNELWRISRDTEMPGVRASRGQGPPSGVVPGVLPRP